MRIADLSSGSAKLQHALKVLQARWEQTQLDWHDPVSRRFDQEYMAAIEPQVMATLERLGSLAQVLCAAENECS